MTWTPEMETELARRYPKEGWKAFACEYGLTKGQVVGKANRLAARRGRPIKDRLKERERRAAWMRKKRAEAKAVERNEARLARKYQPIFDIGIVSADFMRWREERGYG